MDKFFTDHPSSVGETYGQHMFASLSFAAWMLAGFVVCVTHAVFPFLFESAASGIINRLHERAVVARRRHRPAPELHDGGALSAIE